MARRAPPAPPYGRRAEQPRDSGKTRPQAGLGDLDPAVKDLAERYLSKGDIWRFLRDVSLEMRRHKKDAEITKAKEQEASEAFITQVLRVRDEEHKAAWQKYMALMEVLRKANAKKIDLDRLQASGLGGALRRCQGEDDAQQDLVVEADRSPLELHRRARERQVERGLPEGAYVSVPSRAESILARARAMLTPHDAASTASLPSGGWQSHATSSSSSGVVGGAGVVDLQPSLATTLHGAGSSIGSLMGGLPQQTAAGGGEGGCTASLEGGAVGSSISTMPSSLTLPSTHHLPLGRILGTPLPGDASGDGGAVVGGSSSDSLSSGPSSFQVQQQATSLIVPLAPQHMTDEQSMGGPVQPPLDRSLGRRSRTRCLDEVDGGFVRWAVQQLREGVDDSVARLLDIAILRGFVPSSMEEGTTARQAYERLLRLPPHSLARRRHEQEAREAARSYAQNLRYEGFLRIRDLKPLSRHRHVLGRYHLSPELQAVLADVLRELECWTSLSKIGKPHTYCKYDHWSHARYLLSQLNRSGWWQDRYYNEPQPAAPADTPDEQQEEEQQQEAATLRLSGVEAAPGEQAPPSAPCSSASTYSSVPPTRSTATARTSPPSTASSLSHLARPPTGLAPLEDVMRSLRQAEERWGTLRGPIDRFLVVAAFYILPHPPVQPQPGPSAFDAFVAEVRTLPSLAERRRATKLRYQRCIIMAAPYIDRLRRAGVRRVADLSRIDLPSWGFEPAYTKQVEDMSAKMIAKHLYARATGRSQEQEARFICGPFDPRFQRSSTDPWGRAPRLGRLRSKIREDHDKKGTAQRQHLPGGLWSCKPQYTEDEDDDEDEDGEEGGGVPEGPPVAGWRFKEEEKDEDQEERDGPGAIDLQGLSIEHSQPTKARDLRPRRQGKGRLVCQYRGCGQAFLHLSTLRAHERTHEHLGEYHRWKRQAQVYRDSPFQPHVPAYLPPYRIRVELERLHTQGVPSAR